MHTPLWLSGRGPAGMGAARARPRRALAQAGDHDRQHGLEDGVVGDQREFVAHPPDVRVLLLADRPVGLGPGANMMPLIVAQATILFGYAMVDLAAISFLGLGGAAARAELGRHDLGESGRYPAGLPAPRPGRLCVHRGGRDRRQPAVEPLL